MTEKNKNPEIAEEEHPIDTLESAITEIASQLKRLQNRRPTDLKVELKNNVYPILALGFSSILEYMTGLEDEREFSDERTKILFSMNQKVGTAISAFEEIIENSEIPESMGLNKRIVQQFLMDIKEEFNPMAESSIEEEEEVEPEEPETPDTPEETEEADAPEETEATVEPEVTETPEETEKEESQ